MTGNSEVTVFICVTCETPDADSEEPAGRLLFNTVSDRLRTDPACKVRVTPVA